MQTAGRVETTATQRRCSLLFQLLILLMIVVNLRNFSLFSLSLFVFYYYYDTVIPYFLNYPPVLLFKKATMIVDSQT